MKASYLTHLYSRIGFGLNRKGYQSLKGISKSKIVDAIFESSKAPIPLKIDLSAYDSLFLWSLRIIAKNKSSVKEISAKEQTRY